MIGCKEFDNDFIMDIYIYIYIDRVIQAPTWGCSWGEFDGYNHGNNLHELGYEARTTSFFCHFETDLDLF